MNRLRFSLLGLLFCVTFVAGVMTVVIKWTTVGPQLQGKSAPIHLIYLGSWQLILTSSAIVIVGACAVEVCRQSVSVPRPRLAVAGWILLATCFGVAAVIDWRETHATGSEVVAELGTSVVAFLRLCGLFCFFHARQAYRSNRDSSSGTS